MPVPEPEPTPPPTPPAPTTPTACSIEVASCRCDLGDIDSCVEHAASIVNDATGVTMAIALCERGEPVGCLMAASGLEKQKVAERFGTTPAALRARAETGAREACANNGGACFRYGQAVASGVYVTGRYKRPDLSGGLAMIAQACELGYGNACAALSEAHRTGAGRKRDAAKAKKLATRACDAKSPSGCRMVAASLSSRDTARAAELYTRACDGFDAEGCAQAGAAYRKAKSLDAALSAFLRGCDRGDHAQCADAAVIIDGGMSANRDAERARSLFRQACDDEVPLGCAGLAEMTLGARGGPRDWGRSIDLFARACEMKDRGACNRARVVAKAPPDWHCSTVDDCKKQCAERIMKSCTEQGRLVARTETDSYPSNCQESRTLYSHACDSGDPEACVLLGHAESDEAAERLYGQACKAGLHRGCDLQTYARQTRTVFQTDSKQQRAKARSALERACRTNSDACVWFAVALDRDINGDGKAALASACTRGSAMACALAAPEPNRCELAYPMWIRDYWK